MLFYIIVTLLLLLIYYKVIKPHQYWKDRGVPYIKPWPIFGNIGPYVLRLSNIIDTLGDLYNENPERRYVGIYQFQLPALLIRDPELIRKITIKEFDTFSEVSGFTSPQNDKLANKALPFLTRETGWQDMRSILSPAFTSSKMKMMFCLMDKCGDNFVNYFLQQEEDLITVDVKNTYNRIANDIIASTAFGVECDSLKDRKNEFYTLGKEATNRTGVQGLILFLSSFNPIMAKLLNIRFFTVAVEAFFTKVIKENIKFRETNKIVRPDVLHLLMEAKNNRLNVDNQKNVIDLSFSVAQESELTANKKVKSQLTDEDITAQAILFFLAGYEGTSATLSYVSHYLSLNPNVQQKLQHENDETIVTSKEKITYETLLKMKYLSGLCCFRKTTKSFTIEPELSGEKPVHLENGSTIWIPTGAIHRDPKYFPNPNKFDPERFNDENKHKIKPNTYLPFGSGPRNCIGSRFALLQIKLIIVKLLKDFNVVAVEKTVAEWKIPKGSFNFVPTEGVWLGFAKRK